MPGGRLTQQERPRTAPGAAEVCAAVFMQSASVSKAVAFLEGQGLIRRERDERSDRGPGRGRLRHPAAAVFLRARYAAALILLPQDSMPHHWRRLPRDRSM